VPVDGALQDVLASKLTPSSNLKSEVRTKQKVEKLSRVKKKGVFDQIRKLLPYHVGGFDERSMV
jgi:hypothetical protein